MFKSRLSWPRLLPRFLTTPPAESSTYEGANALGFLGHKMLQYWPVFAFAFSLFVASISVAIGATMWLAGKLSEQDARRIELKESILLEVRETRRAIYQKLDEQRDSFDRKSELLGKELKEADTKLTRLDTIVSSREWAKSRPMA